jgi:hypothetical protein
MLKHNLIKQEGEVDVLRAVFARPTLLLEGRLTHTVIISAQEGDEW